MTSPFIGNNNTILNVMGGTSTTATAIAYSYGSVTNAMEQYPPVAMTSDTSGGYTSSASGSFGANVPYRAFDNNAATLWSSLQNYNTSTGAYTGSETTATTTVPLLGEWLQLDMPQPIILNVIGIIPTTPAQPRSPNNWRICARNLVTDTWQVIYTSTNTIFVSGSIIQVIDVPSVVTAYSSFRLVFLNAGSDGTSRVRIDLQEVKFFGYPPTRTNTGTWSFRQKVYFLNGFSQPTQSQQPTVNTTVTTPTSVDFSRTAQQNLFSGNTIPFLISANGGCTVVTYVNMGTGGVGTNNERIVDCGRGATDGNIILRRSGTTNSFEFVIYEGSSIVASVSGGTIVPGEWTSIVGRYIKSSNVIQLYQNRILVNTATPSAAPSDRLPNSNFIGRSNDLSDTVFLNGSIGGLLMYDRALSDAEVTSALNSIYTQNQTTNLKNIYPSFTTVRVVFFASYANSFFQTSTASLKYNRSFWVAAGSNADVGTYPLSYSNNGIIWASSSSGLVTVTSSSNTFSVVVSTSPSGTGSDIISSIVVPDGVYEQFGLASYLTNQFSVLAAPLNSIEVGKNTGFGRFQVSISAGGYFVGTRVIGADLTVQMGFVNMTSGYSTTVTAPNHVQGVVFSSGFAVETNNTLWVAGGRGTNTLAYSNDGINWTGNGSTIFTTNCYAVAWSTGLSRWVAGGDGTNGLAYSNDGINWIGLGTGVLARCWGVKWNGSLWVAVGLATNTIAYSTDGISWTGLGTSVISSQGFDVAWNGKLWVAVGSGSANVIATSPDGINWTGRGKPTGTQQVNRIMWNGSFWVATGTATTGGNNVLISQDGITWTGSTGQSLFAGGGYATASRFTLL